MKQMLPDATGGPAYLVIMAYAQAVEAPHILGLKEERVNLQSRSMALQNGDCTKELATKVACTGVGLQRHAHASAQ